MTKENVVLVGVGGVLVAIIAYIWWSQYRATSSRVLAGSEQYAPDGQLLSSSFNIGSTWSPAAVIRRITDPILNPDYNPGVDLSAGNAIGLAISGSACAKRQGDSYCIQTPQGVTCGPHVPNWDTLPQC